MWIAEQEQHDVHGLAGHHQSTFNSPLYALRLQKSGNETEQIPASTIQEVSIIRAI